MTTANDILGNNNRPVPSVGPQESVLDAAKLMNEYKIGALLVREKERCMGIFTERDLLRRVVSSHRDLAKTKVADVMSDKVIVCAPDTNIEEARRIMVKMCCRNLPVVDEDGDVIGMITLSDLNAHEYEGQELEIDYLKKYLYDRR